MRFVGANTRGVSLQTFAVQLVAEAVVWPLAQARVRGFQFLFFREQGKPFGFQLRVGHGVPVYAELATYVPNSRSYPGLGIVHIDKQRSQRMYRT